MSFLKELVTSDNYNYYPKTAIDLCVISYSDFDKITDEVYDQTDTEVVWGPYELKSDFLISYSRMFVAKRKNSDEYFVVIRGTNPFSLESWLDQDFYVDTTQPFGDLPGDPPGIPADALISQGTFNGVSDLITLGTEQGEANIIEFLKSVTPDPQAIYVTGHSLGGTLTAPLFAYINAMLYGTEPVHNMACWSFAGLTPGGTGFNEYFNNKVLPNDQKFLWRIQNTLDIAPFLFYSKSKVSNVYDSQGLQPEFPVDEVITKLFDEAAAAGIDYAQPQQGQPISGQFDNTTPNSDSYTLQAMHQHHATTYKPLVYAFYS